MSLRDEMPQTAAFIDELREVFGREAIDAQIRAGMRGEPMFWARENGHEIGTKPMPGVFTATRAGPSGDPNRALVRSPRFG